MGGGRWMARRQTRMSPSNNQGQAKAKNDNNNNKKACDCGGFLSTTSYTSGGYISSTVEKERSPVCDISLQSNVGTAHGVKSLKKFGIPVPL